MCIDGDVEVCGKCSLEHDTRTCNSAGVKCVNCTSAAKALKLEINTNHSAFSMECDVYNVKLIWNVKGSTIVLLATLMYSNQYLPVVIK